MSTPKILAVRVQDDLHSAFVNESGNTTLSYNKDGTRNTAHFSLNSITSDINGYGAFNENPDGSLKGKIVFISPLDEMKPPSSLNQIDTWFRFDVDKDKRTLELGKNTVVVVPQGTSVPEGMHALYYDSTIEGRDKAVEKYIESQGVQLEYAQTRNWAGYSQSTAQEWSQGIVDKYYEGDPQIRIGAHDGSLDQELERCSVKGLVENFKKERFYRNDYGVDHDFVGVIDERVQKHRATLTQFIQTCPQHDQGSIPFYAKCLEKLTHDLQEAKVIETKWEYKQIQELTSAIEKGVSTLPGTGDIYVLKEGASSPTSYTIQDLSAGLANEQFDNTSKFWRTGHLPNWEDQNKFGVQSIIAQHDLKLPRPATKVEELLGITGIEHQKELDSLQRINTSKNIEPAKDEQKSDNSVDAGVVYGTTTNLFT